MLVQKKFCVTKHFGLKKNLVFEIFLGQKKVLSQKRFYIKKNLGSKKDIGSIEIYCRWPQKESESGGRALLIW